jgi:hypothetical protein
MWFGLTDQHNSNAMISQLAAVDHETDWGMRIISGRSPKFSGGGYHYGSVWPLFTGWASVGEYRYHRAQPAYDNLRANALLALDGSLGHVTEVLSGDYYQPLSTSSPHQIWSAAMVVSPLLRGMFGLSADARAATLTFSPHLPADWNSIGLDNLRVGENKIHLHLARTGDGIVLEASRTAGAGDCFVEFEPAISVRATAQRVELNGRTLPFHVDANEEDQHVRVRFAISEGKETLRIATVNDFAVTATAVLPPLGSMSAGIRILSESWSTSRDQLTLNISGAPDARYELKLWNAGQIATVKGADLQASGTGSILALQMPSGTAGQDYVNARVVIHFGDPRNTIKRHGNLKEQYPVPTSPRL